jgi:DNA (cytosine-5)-methyltransferase 1
MKSRSQASRDESAPVVIDLFCGAGGLSAGLEEAGFHAIAGVDFDRHAMSTFAANHPHAVPIQDDIANVTGRHLRSLSNNREVDLVAGGPSCQGYSTTGKRIEDDPRNFLFKHFVRLVGEVQPKFILVENVKGLLSFRSGYFRDLISESFERVGYRVICKVLCAADYGVPQLRERVVFIGTRLSDAELSFPEPTHGPEGTIFSGARRPYVTVGEAIGDLPLMRGDVDRELWDYACDPQNEYQRYARAGIRGDTVTLHQANGASAAALEVIRLVAEGQGVRSIPPDLLPERFKKMRTIADGSLRKDCTTLYHRLSRSKPGYTITCYFRNVASGPFVHPLENRSLSYREAARIMSFRDRYRFQGSMLTRQIGNAVPPLLAKALGKHIRKLLEGSTRTPTARSSKRPLVVA